VVDTVASVFAGVALAAACGFRVFVPLLVLSIASTLGAIPLADDFAWLATMPALIALATATIMEIAAYYVPWLDHALDVVATPAAILAGVITTAAVVADLSPVLRWSLAIDGTAPSQVGCDDGRRGQSHRLDRRNRILHGDIGAGRGNANRCVLPRARDHRPAGDDCAPSHRPRPW
jgi:hypothetical protein